MQVVNLALLLELQELIREFGKNPPPELRNRLLMAEIKLDTALEPLLAQEVEVINGH